MARTGITLQHEPVLHRTLEKLGRTAVCFSGGTDSEVLLRAAADTLGTGNIAAVMALTPFLAERHRVCAENTAASLGITLHKVQVNLLSCNDILNNTFRRCYFCKSMIYRSVKLKAAEIGFHFTADGTNLDDSEKERPGLEAAGEQSVLHPLLNAGMTKRRVRNLGKILGMKDSERPEDSCMATRFPKNKPIEEKMLVLIEKIEQSTAAARGRIRAVPEKGTVTLKFETVDLSVINAVSKELFRLCDTYCTKLILNNVDSCKKGNLL
ncbi:hypothetical protein CSA37_07515 [Candidatus Fermentibacteria bacterium]|nr:MAG: hypothetical protein CSA37_07515 [Candidatus Fermentibacteria bacterium]